MNLSEPARGTGQLGAQKAAENLRSLLADILPDGEISLKVIAGKVIRLNAGDQSYLVKWISAKDSAGQNELRLNRMLAGMGVVSAPRLMFEKQVEGGIVAGWEWIDGHDLRFQDRRRLPEVFARLGELHRSLRNQAEVIVPLRSRPFASIRELLAAEAYRLGSLYSPGFGERCLEIFSHLEAGYPTLIHGDMHPGNVLVSPERVWFIDWSYACNSLNLFDLDYIQSLPLPGAEPVWTVIGPDEALPVLSAYFHAAGLDHIDLLKTHYAVMLWNLLRKHENCIENTYVAEINQTRLQIQALLAAL